MIFDVQYKMINDDFYPEIKNKLLELVPEFEFDGEDEVYLVMSEFSQFIINVIDKHNVFRKCCCFIDEAVSGGGSDTETVLVIQVFQNLFYRKEYVEKCLEVFDLEAKTLFKEYYIKFLNDYTPFS